MAADVARAFQSLANGSVGRSVVGGSFRGTLSGWSSAAMNAESNMVVFTAATANTNVTDISYSFSSASILRDNDLFVWNADDVGTGAIDTIKDFSPWNGSSGDRLNLTALLGGSSQSTNPGDWIRIVNGQTVNGVSGSSSLVIDVDGPDSGTVEQVIVLEGVDWSAYTLDQIYRSGVLVLTVNQAPALTSIATNPTFTESNRLGVQAAGVAMFSGTTISTNDDGQAVKGLRLTVSGLVDGDDETLVIDGSTIALGASRTGATAINGMSYSVSYSNGTSTVVLTQSSGLATAVANAMVNAIGYKNLSVDDPSPGQRTFTLTQVSDTGGTIKGGIDTTALNLASTVTVVATNDAPTLTATALDPSFVEATGVGAQAAAVKVFSSANASAIEGAQSLKSLTFTLSGLVDGASERITVDGRAITLGASSTGKTTTNLLDYSVDISNGLATVVLSASGISSAVVNAVLNGMSYQNTLTDTPTPGARTFTLKQLVDTGGTVNGGLDTLALNLSSSVTVVGANDAPAVGLPSSNYAHNSGTRSLTGLSVSDADSAADTITVTLEVTNGVLSASSASVTVSGSGTAALTLAGSAANINSLLSAGGVSFTTGELTAPSDPCSP